MLRFLKSRFGPDGFTRDGTAFDAPAVGENLDQEESMPRYSLGGRELGGREVVTARARHLDPQDAGGDVEGESEVPAGSRRGWRCALPVRRRDVQRSR
jgi:hypothetical protein